MVARKSPKTSRDSNPDNEYRKKIRERNKALGVPKGKTPKIVRMSQEEIEKINKKIAKKA